MNYHVKAQWFTVEGAYDNWVATREPPLFGTEPDSRIWNLAEEATDPAAFRILDIGAGTGRNSLALARRGHPVDAVEMSPKFAEILRGEAQREGLDVRVIERDVFTTTDDLRRDYDLILLSEVVSDFRTAEQVRGMFALAAQCLNGGGQLVFNVFLGRDGYVPDASVRELGQQCYTSIFTYPEIEQAASATTRCTTTRRAIWPPSRGHRPAGTRTGSAESTSSRSTGSCPRSNCAGWCTGRCSPRRRPPATRLRRAGSRFGARGRRARRSTLLRRTSWPGGRGSPETVSRGKSGLHRAG